MLSVIIPCYNAAATLGLALTALERARAAGEPIGEVIVVDDGSTDPSAAIALDAGVRLERLARRAGPSAARNEGARLARHEILWFLDADVEPLPGAGRIIAGTFAAPPEIDALIGSYDDAPSHPGAVSQFKNLFHHFVHQQAGEHIASFWAGCGALRRDVFFEVGGFDADRWGRPSIEDIHLGYRLARSGRQIHVLKDVQVRHHKHWTLRSLVRTDLRDRAIPWTLEMLARPDRGRGELNLGGHYRFSVASMGLAILAAIGGFFITWLLFLPALLLAAALIPHRGLIAFFRRRRGWAFLFRAIPLLWLYFTYCGVGFMLGVMIYLRQRLTGHRHPHPGGQGPA